MRIYTGILPDNMTESCTLTVARKQPRTWLDKLLLRTTYFYETYQLANTHVSNVFDIAEGDIFYFTNVNDGKKPDSLLGG